MSASPKQINFIKNLFNDASKGTEALQAAGKDELVASLAAKVTPLQDILVAVLKGDDISGTEARQVIDTLILVTREIKDATAPPMPVGLKEIHPKKVIPNRYAKACRSCGTNVAEGTGYAVLSTAGSWFTYCHACAHMDPVERAAQVQAETAARQAAYAAARAESDAKLKAARVLSYEINLFTRDLVHRAGLDDAARPKVRVALPSATGNNDLDFFTVKLDSYGRGQVLRVIGGHSDQPLNLSASHATLERLVLTDDIPATMALFGQQLGYCGRCGRHLTDEVSRANGIGPDCLEMMF